MTTFAVTPGAPYRISVVQPQVAGTPTPSISYAWSLAGVPIGSGRVINYTFDGSGLPSTLRCVITLSNVAGSVSRTLEATVQAAANLPVLNAVTIRDNAAPTTIISSVPIESGDGHIGRVLRVGGPTSADLNPTGSNFSSLAYQWRRGGVPIAGATGANYALTEADDNLTITAVVTAANDSGVSKRSRSVLIGVSALNTNSKIGTHLPGASYYGGGVPFANLIYNTIQDYGKIPFTNKNIWGLDRFTSWSGSPYFTADGWPIRNDNGAFSSSNPCSIYLMLNGTERVWSVLGLTGGFIEPPTATPVFNSKGEPTNKATYTLPEGIAGRTFTATVTCYWEGTGKVTLGRADRPVTVSSVNFTGPDGDGPFGDGPRTMSRSSITATGLNQIILSIVESSASDPVRNIVVLVSNVTDAATGEVVYAGFDHTTYQPFQLYPQFIESHRHFSHIRSLATQWQHHEPTPSRGIFEDTGFTLQISESGEAEMPIVTTGWTRSQPSAPGFEKGFAAINRPTNICFGNSLRAYIEVCNQLNADLWWCHPVPTVAVGTRHGDGSITYARQRGRNTADPNQVGRLLLDEAYANGFADTIEQHLKPGLKVYSEWANEVWNWSSTYWHGTSWAWTFALRAIADVERGGDGGLWYANRNLAAPAIYAGVSLGTNGNYAQTAFSAAASALLAEAIRDRLGDSDREIVCVAAGQSASVARSANSLGQFWAAMPKLFKQLDAVAHAPYRSWWGNGSAFDTQLANDGFESVWQEIESVRGGLLPYANLPSLTLRDDSYWGTRSRANSGAFWGYPFQRAWKDLAIDRPSTLTVAGSLWYQRAFTPPGWGSSQRRWNLALLTYEGGNHHIPVSAGAKLQSFPATMHPSYKTFTLRYMEMIFAHGPKGLTRDPASASEEALYRPGMVPMGVVENAEPLHDGFTFLTTIIEPSFRHGMFWGLQWWNGQLDAPQAEGAKEAVRLGVGLPEWWLTYQGVS